MLHYALLIAIGIVISDVLVCALTMMNSLLRHIVPLYKHFVMWVEPCCLPHAYPGAAWLRLRGEHVACMASGGLWH